MPSLIVILVASLTAMIGPLVDAPASLTSLAVCVALITGWISVNQLRVQLRTATLKLGKQKTADAPAGENPGPDPAPAVESRGPVVGAPAPSTETQILQGRLRMESMRVQALESEIQEIRQRNDELMRERVDLIRQASAAPTGETIPRPANRPDANVELVEDLRQRDEWIQSQRSSLDEFHAGIGSVEQALARSVARLEQVATRQIQNPPQDDHQDFGLQTRLSSLLAALENASAFTFGTGPENIEFRIPGSLDHVSGILLKLNNRIEEIADHARVTAMNAKILKDRPAESETPELLAGLSIETSAIASGLENIRAVVAPLTPDLETLRRDLELARETMASASSRISSNGAAIVARANDLAGGIKHQVEELNAMIESVSDAGKLRRAGQEELRATMDDVLDALTAAAGTAKTMSLSVERMIEVSRLATAGKPVGNQAVRKPQEVALGD